MFKAGDIAHTSTGGWDYYIEVMYDEEPGQDMEGIVIQIDKRGQYGDLDLHAYYSDFESSVFEKSADPRIAREIAQLELNIDKLIMLCLNKES